MKLLKIGIVCTLLITVAMPLLALDYATATGADILKEISKPTLTNVQLDKINEKLMGKILTFITI